MADIVAIEQEGVAVHQRQLLFDFVGDGRLARARQTGEPQHARCLVLHCCVMIAGDVGRLPMDVLAAPQAEMQHACADRAMGDLVDQDEPAQRTVAGIGIEHDPPVGGDLAHADLIEVKRLRGEVRPRA